MLSRIHFSGDFEKRKGKCGLNKRRRRGASGWGWGQVAALCAVTLWALAGTCSALSHMELQYTWGTYGFAFQDDQQRQEMLARSDYAPENQTAFDVDGDPHTGNVFMAFAAVLPGSQVSLATIVEKDKRDSPLLAPYPDWSWHAGHRGCGGMTSVFRIYIDKCRRLWAIDSGVVDIGNTFQHQCPPQLFVFDLKTDTLLTSHNFTLPPDQSENRLMLNVIAEQIGASCNDDAYAYISDPVSVALYVYSLRSQRSWRVESDTFHPESNATNFQVNGSRFTLQDGILGLAQDPTYLYYHAFSSFKEGKVLKSVLREESLFANSSNLAANDFRYIGSRTNQSAGEALAKNNVLFFHQMATESIFCWDASTEYKPENHHVVEHDDSLLHFVSNIKIIHGHHTDEIWAIDNNGQRLFSGEYEPNQPYTVNVLRGSVYELSSKCEGGWDVWIFYFWEIFFWW